MAEIAPNSTIRLFSGVPLDQSYKNTIYFENISQQLVYFTFDQQNPIAKYQFTAQYYTRVNRRQIKLKKCADDVYDCNYLSFQNTTYGNKWFYAFIDSIEWVNNEVCLITFSIDVMQTYFFDAVLKDCFVEREHSATDVIGDNTLPENVYCGDEYVSADNYVTVLKQFSLDSIILLASENLDGTSPTASVRNKMGCGLVRTGAWNSDHTFPLTTLQNWVDYKGGDAIVSLYQVPEEILRDNFGSGYTETTSPISMLPSSLDGYQPKNNKMYTFPYCRNYITAYTGDVFEIKNELCSDPTHQTFRINGASVPTPQVAIYPINYRKISGADYENGLTIEDFPQIPFTGDVYKAYISQNKLNRGLKIMGAVAGVALAAYGAYTANPYMQSASQGNLTGAVGEIYPEAKSALTMAFMGGAMARNSVKSLLQGDYSAEVAPNNAKNLKDIDAIKVMLELYGFYLYKTTIKREYAEAIDNYFTMYGYATHKIKVPNRHVRPYYTYTKTAECTIVGKMPADDILTLEGIYNSGITFWDRYATVGDYSVNNAPVQNP